MLPFDSLFTVCCFAGTVLSILGTSTWKLQPLFSGYSLYVISQTSAQGCVIFGGGGADTDASTYCMLQMFVVVGSTVVDCPVAGWPNNGQFCGLGDAATTAQNGQAAFIIQPGTESASLCQFVSSM